MVVSDEYLDTLRRINSVARSHISRSSTTAFPPTTSPPHRVSPPPHVDLPDPESIAHILMESGCQDPAVANHLSDLYIQSGYRLRALYQKTHRKAYERMPQNLGIDPTFSPTFLKLISLVEKQYQDQLKTIQQLAVNKVQFAPANEPPRQVKTKPTFNQEFVPVLEKYFQYNAYPSAPDRRKLAVKSMMSARQIEVWFQNHRRRAKKEGKPLKRLQHDSLPVQFSLKSLEVDAPCTYIPEKDRKTPQSSSRSTLNLNNVQHTLRTRGSILPPPRKDARRASLASPPFNFPSKPPPHAFPTLYHPSCDQDRFPVKTKRYTFPAPTWPRKSPSIPFPCSVIPDFDQFIVDFSAKLTLREINCANDRSSISPGTDDGRSWSSFRQVVPCKAPLYALLRPTSEALSSSASYSRHLLHSPAEYFPASYPSLSSLSRKTWVSKRHPTFLPRDQLDTSASSLFANGTKTSARDNTSSRTPSLHSSRSFSASSDSSCSSAPTTPLLQDSSVLDGHDWVSLASKNVQSSILCPASMS